MRLHTHVVLQSKSVDNSHTLKVLKLIEPRFNGSFPEEAVAVATMSTHGVNNAQAVKAGVVWGRQSDAAAGEMNTRACLL